MRPLKIWTMEELTKKLEEVEKEKFYLEMKDQWDEADWATNKEYTKIILALKGEIKARA